MPPDHMPVSTRRVLWLHKKLAKACPEPKHCGHGPGLDQLIATVLSQNTNDKNSGEGFRRLKKRFPKWDQAAAATVEQIAEPIRVAGLANQKSNAIKKILDRIKSDYGRYSLAPISRKATEAARAYLLSLPGVGAKTAACVLLFAYGMPVFPVDTHIHRVCKRLGLIGPGATADQAHYLLGAAVPPDLCYPLHLLIIQHGRRTCHARKPECAGCVLRSRCPSREDRPARKTA